MTGLWGSLVEAWEELRIHKLRVLLSLVGVAVSVMAMTSVTAAGQMLQSISTQLSSTSGKPATVQVYIGPMNWTDETDFTAAAAAYDAFIERYQVEGATQSLGVGLPMVINGELLDVATYAVDPNWNTVVGDIVTEGRWFVDGDEQNMSPPIIVNSVLLEQLGYSQWSGPFTVRLQGDRPTTATVIGTYPDQWQMGQPEAYMLYDSYQTWLAQPDMQNPADLRIWIDPSLVDELQTRLQSELSVIDGEAWDVQVYRLDAFGQEDFTSTFRFVVTAIGMVIMGLSALNLLNIAIVTLRQRIREIGVRRALGASSGRVFFSIMLESVVATFIAGGVGVVASIVLLKNISLVDLLYGGMPIPGMVDPGYPISAALTGLIASVVVGALCGLIPGLMAVNIRPIEAIRY